mmetsp:Transcript_50482/g.109839  ORF Transcript_50482/g.109839 Transcript_50482/m.109839 type:complete len:640 (+) Transcript_50482:878-2797(+)
MLDAQGAPGEGPAGAREAVRGRRARGPGGGDVAARQPRCPRRPHRPLQAGRVPHGDAEVWAGPDQDGPGGQAGAAHRPRGAARQGHPHPRKALEVQPDLRRGAGRRQDLHRAGPGLPHRPRQGAPLADRQEGDQAGPGLPPRRHALPRGLRGEAPGRRPGGDGLQPPGHPRHRRDPHPRRRRQQRRRRRRHGRGEPPEAGPGPRRAPVHGRHDPGRVPEVHREGSGPGAPLPAGRGAGAVRGGGREDPHGARAEVREAPPAALHAGGAEGGREAGLAVHQRPLPARQGHRRHGRGRVQGAAAGLPGHAVQHGPGPDPGGGARGAEAEEARGRGGGVLQRGAEPEAEGGGARGEAGGAQGHPGPQRPVRPEGGARGGDARAPGAAPGGPGGRALRRGGDPEGPQGGDHRALPRGPGRRGRQPRAAGGRPGHRGGRGLRSGWLDRHRRGAGLRQRVRAPDAARGDPPRVGHRTERGGGGGLPLAPPRARRAPESQPAHRELHVLRSHGRGQDAALQDALLHLLRLRGRHGSPGHERVHGEAHRVEAHRRPPRLRRLQRGRHPDRGGAQEAVLFGALRRGGEGAPRRLQHDAAAPRRRSSHGLQGPHGLLRQHPDRAHHEPRQPRSAEGRSRRSHAGLRRSG